MTVVSDISRNVGYNFSSFGHNWPFCRTHQVLSDITGRFVRHISLSDILGTSDILSRNRPTLYTAGPLRRYASKAD